MLIVIFLTNLSKSMVCLPCVKLILCNGMDLGVSVLSTTLQNRYVLRIQYCWPVLLIAENHFLRFPRCLNGGLRGVFCIQIWYPHNGYFVWFGGTFLQIHKALFKKGHPLLVKREDFTNHCTPLGGKQAGWTFPGWKSTSLDS